MKKTPDTTLPTQRAPRNQKNQCEIIKDLFAGRIKEQELTPTNLEYYERVQSCYRSQMAGDAQAKTVKKLMKLYGVSNPTACRIYHDTEDIFGSSATFHEKFIRHKTMEFALKAYRMAELARSPKAMVAALSTYIRASGIENQSPDLPNFGELNPGDVYTLLPNSLVTAIAAHLGGGVVDLNAADYIIEIPENNDDAGDAPGHSAG